MNAEIHQPPLRVIAKQADKPYTSLTTEAPLSLEKPGNNLEWDDLKEVWERDPELFLHYLKAARHASQSFSWKDRGDNDHHIPPELLMAFVLVENLGRLPSPDSQAESYAGAYGPPQITKQTIDDMNQYISSGITWTNYQAAVEQGDLNTIMTALAQVIARKIQILASIHPDYNQAVSSLIDQILTDLEILRRTAASYNYGKPGMTKEWSLLEKTNQAVGNDMTVADYADQVLGWTQLLGRLYDQLPETEITADMLQHVFDVPEPTPQPITPENAPKLLEEWFSRLSYKEKGELGLNDRLTEEQTNQLTSYVIELIKRGYSREGINVLLYIVQNGAAV